MPITHPAAQPIRPSILADVVGRFERIMIWALALAVVAVVLFAAWMRYTPMLWMAAPPALGLICGAFFFLGLHNGNRLTTANPKGDPELIARASFAWVEDVRASLDAVENSGKAGPAALAEIEDVRKQLHDHEIQIATRQARMIEISDVAAITAAHCTATEQETTR